MLPFHSAQLRTTRRNISHSIEKWKHLSTKLLCFRNMRMLFTVVVLCGLGLRTGRNVRLSSEQVATFTSRVAEDARLIFAMNTPPRVTWSPTIVQNMDGTLLVAFETAYKSKAPDALVELYSSKDGGHTWTHLTSLRNARSPQLIKCKSGIYIMFLKTIFKRPSDLFITKMIDDRGTVWSKPSQLTFNVSVVSTNTGVDVSGGRVTKSYELIPSLAVVRARTVLKHGFIMRDRTFHHSPYQQQSYDVYQLSVQEIDGFVAFCTVTVDLGGGNKRFFRILGLEENVTGAWLTVRYEHYNAFLKPQFDELEVPQSAVIEITHGTNVYGSTDWVTGVMQAEEEADLTNPIAWKFLSRDIGNPISLYSTEVRRIFDIAFRADNFVIKDLLGKPFPNLKRETALELGFGSLYWMEGVITRAQDRHGGNGKLLVISRVNNDLLCNLAAVSEVTDESSKLDGQFLRYTFIPGLSNAHPAIVYDDTSDMYWMVTNMPRDSVRRWSQSAHTRLHITKFSSCEIERSMLYLFYSSNMLDWIPAGVVDFQMGFNRHFSYPHMLVMDDDLLVVSRSASNFNATEQLHTFYNNHNSNSITFHRIVNFRRLALQDWLLESGELTVLPRGHT